MPHESHTMDSLMFSGMVTTMMIGGDDDGDTDETDQTEISMATMVQNQHPLTHPG